MHYKFNDFIIYGNKSKDSKDGEGWLIESKSNFFGIEKNIFLGNKNKIINSESVSISGKINQDIISIEWIIQRVN